MRIIIGSDHIGFSLKKDLITYLKGGGHRVVDVGCASSKDPVDYPDIAVEVAKRIASGEFNRGILVCGTGIGMAIAANKIPGVRAANCHDAYSAERARKSNDAQIITFGAQVVAPTLARVLLDRWLESDFESERSERKLDKLKALDAEYRTAPPNTGSNAGDIDP
jgi:ribose 5-phosphate isomerase B